MAVQLYFKAVADPDLQIRGGGGGGGAYPDPEISGGGGHWGLSQKNFCFSALGLSLV